MNQITIETTLVPVTECSLFNVNNLWLTIYPDSVLSIELIPAPIQEMPASTLQEYPKPFITHPDLSNLAFVLTQGKPSSWNTALKIAYDLGYYANGALFGFQAVYDGELTDEIRKNHNLLIVGLPSSMPVITELRDSMPLPFEGDKNATLIQGENIAYRISEDITLGYIELFASPWNSSQVILAVLGSNEEGLSWAGNVLTDDGKRAKLNGNFAVTDNVEVMSADTRTGVGFSNITQNLQPQATILPQVTPQMEEIPVNESIMTRRDWIPTAVVILVLLILGVILFVSISARRKNL